MRVVHRIDPFAAELPTQNSINPAITWVVPNQVRVFNLFARAHSAGPVKRQQLAVDRAKRLVLPLVYLGFEFHQKVGVGIWGQ